jgi:hypothetical protein
MMGLVLDLHAASTLAMCGLIWFVQVVHYPLFAGVDGGDFAKYEARHQARTTLVVGPLMLVEAATAAIIVVRHPSALSMIGAVCVVLLWLSTGLIQVPLHRALSNGFNTRAHRRLVGTNWLRTALWSMRSVIALALLPVGSGA